MADKTISELTAAATVEEEDLFVLEQNSTAKKLSGQTLVTYLLSMIDGHGGISSVTWVDSGTSGNGQYHTGTITYADGTTDTIQFRDGLQGSTGAASYVWIKWASRNPVADSDLSNTPDAWMGIYSGTLSTAPTSRTMYKWYNIKGATGNGAQLVSQTVQYQESTSATSATGTWQSTVPTVAPGNYLWTYTTITFDTGNPVEFFLVSRQGANGIDGAGAVSTVNGISPDGNHDVVVTASNIYDGASTIHDRLASIEGSITTSQAQITATGILKGAGSGVVSAATKGTDYGAKSFTVTLTTSGWSSNAQTVTNSNFAASGYAYFVSPDSSSREAYLDAGIYADDVTVANSMTFHCGSVPSSNLTVNVVRMVSA